MQHDLTLPVLRLDPRAALPAYQSDLAAGLDLSACLPRGEFDSEAITLAPRQILRIPCGIAVAIPPGFEGQVRPRSGLATKHGVTIPNAPGTVDADYRGEMFVALINLGPEPYVVRHGARVAQMVIAPVARAAVVEVPTLEETARGSGGFGSTGGH
ncbi:MAG TPA: dUTP diphosphatase [Phycisphaerales bacterium]|nr:dUTP diphosphatase [Phycisphaerales bacterium]